MGMIEKTYRAPKEEMKNFLVSTLSKLSGFERLEGQQLAKLLIDKHPGKCPYTTNNVSETFSWLYQVGALDYERKYSDRGGGYRLYLFRKVEPETLKELIQTSGDIGPGAVPESRKDEGMEKVGTDAVQKLVDKGKLVASPSPTKKKTKKSRKPCCDNPRPVKSKKTGKRRCKNCGTPLPKKNSKS